MFRFFPRRPVSLLLCGLVLSACAERKVAELAEPSASASIEEIYVATHQSPGGGLEAIRSDRNRDLLQVKVQVSIPSDREPGEVIWPDSEPDADEHFVVVGFEEITEQRDFFRSLAQEDGDEVFVFVHGYNTTTSAALYRLAQMSLDFELPSPRLLFSWPSAASARGYVYDRDSVLFARDSLAATLKGIAERTDKDIVLVAHSMGSLLSMEVLRQLAITGDMDVLDRIASVTLISPDVDPDIFDAQARAIGDLPDPFLILATGTDKALRLSSLLNFGRSRVGSITSASDVPDFDITVIDFTSLADGKNLDHMVPASSPLAIQALRQLSRSELAASTEGTHFLLAGQLGIGSGE